MAMTKLNISAADFHSHNNGIKRKWNIDRQRPVRQPRPDYPEVQKVCVPSCMFHGCLHLTLGMTVIYYFF